MLSGGLPLYGLSAFKQYYYGDFFLTICSLFSFTVVVILVLGDLVVINFVAMETQDQDEKINGKKEKKTL